MPDFARSTVALLLVFFGCWVPVVAQDPAATEFGADAGYLRLLRSHYDRAIADGIDVYGEDKNGLFLWGNHLYYDVFADEIVAFSGGHHEARPLPCAWQLFWDVSPEKTHNYPMSMAEACLTLHQRTGDEQFRQAVLRFGELVALGTPANGGRGAWADQYGRCIHFLVRAAGALNEPRFLDRAKQLAEEAVGHLYSESAGMFRSHPGEDRCDAVDGIGILFLSLIFLETGEEPDNIGFGW